MPEDQAEDARALYGPTIGWVELPQSEKLKCHSSCWFDLGKGQESHLGLEHPSQPAPSFGVR